MALGKPGPGSWTHMNSLGAAPTHLAILCLNDDSSGTAYLVDSGLEGLILPCESCINSVINDIHPCLHTLFAANGSSIMPCTSVVKTLQLRGHLFTYTFMLVAVHQPILGVDILRKHKLLIDVAGRRLLLPSLSHSIPCSETTLPSASVSLVSPFCPFSDLLKQFPRITRPVFNASTVPHGVQHWIPTRGPPFGPALAASHVASSTWRGRSSLTSSNWASSARPRASGPFPATWGPKRRRVAALRRLSQAQPLLGARPLPDTPFIGLHWGARGCGNFLEDRPDPRVSPDTCAS